MFVTFRLPLDSDEAFRRLGERGCVMRTFGHEPLLAGVIRATVQTPPETDRLLAALAELLEREAPEPEPVPVEHDCLWGRRSTVARTTRETAIDARLVIDGTGRTQIATGIGFLDHMLHALAFHACMDLDLRIDGDLEVDEHHTVEDAGIALGQALDRALGDRAGIRRFGNAARAAGRGAGAVRRRPRRPRRLGHQPGAVAAQPVGGVTASLWPHLLDSFARAGRVNLHLTGDGDDDHHVVEAALQGAGAGAARGLRARPAPRRAAVAPRARYDGGARRLRLGQPALAARRRGAGGLGRGRLGRSRDGRGRAPADGAGAGRGRRRPWRRCAARASRRRSARRSARAPTCSASAWACSCCSTRSAEDDAACLGLLPGRVERLEGTARLPHMGWNDVEPVGPPAPARRRPARVRVLRPQLRGPRRRPRRAWPRPRSTACGSRPSSPPVAWPARSSTPSARPTPACRCCAASCGGAMLRRRVIPCLDVSGGRVVKGVNFVNLRDCGDPVSAAVRYAEQGADEICWLNITADDESWRDLLTMVERAAVEVDVPVTRRRRRQGGAPRARPARGRRRQGLDQLRGAAQPRPGRRVRRRARLAVHRRRHRREARRRLVARLRRRRPHPDRRSTRSTGPATPWRAAPASCSSRRWTPTAPSRATRST